MKRFLNNRISTEPTSDDKCLQHLEHDYMVQEYLRESTSTHSNSKEYTHLLNRISYSNRTKRRQLALLTHQPLPSPNSHPSPSSHHSHSSRTTNFLLFEKKIIEEEEVRRHLEEEMSEVSKSINLMKGDVSRILEKNENTSVLEKKIGKVKLVAQDQLKKVSLALQKDHSEILERNNMQIQFNKKLKTICNSENTVLKTIQAQYLRLENRKKLINEKITAISELMRTLSQRERTKEEIHILNERNRISLDQIVKLFDLVSQIRQQGEGHSMERDSDHEEKTLDSLLALKTQRFKAKVKEIQSEIIAYIGELTHSIERMDKEFSINSQKVNEYKKKLESIEEEQVSYQSFLNSARAELVSPQMKREYDRKLASFERTLGLILRIWEFMENHSNFTMLIDQCNNEDAHLGKRRESQSRFYRRSEEFHRTSVMREENNFASKVYELVLYLGGHIDDIDLESEFTMKSLQMSIILWLKGLKNLIKQHRASKSHLKKALSFGPVELKYKSTFELLQEISQSNHYNKYRLSINDDDNEEQEDKLKTMLQLISPKKPSLNDPKTKMESFGGTSANPKAHKHHRTEGDEWNGKPGEGEWRRAEGEWKAKRIEVLEKVDYDYYRMIKNVLQIEKENIKKNYDFNKTFNRSKFTEKDIVQEEKRYESNFALEFIRKNEESLKMESHRSIDSRGSDLQRAGKRKEFHCRTQMSNKKLPVEVPPSKFKDRQFFNAQKLRKSRMANRNSEEGLHSFKERTSVFCGKRGINFADSPAEY